LLLSFVFIASGFITQGFSGELRTFKNQNGQTIRAEVESVDGAYAEIRREDGRKFTIVIETLSQEDQEFLAVWAVGQVVGNERLFDIAARRSDENETRSDGSGIVTESRDGFYEIEMSNRTGNNLEGLELNWLVRIEETRAGGNSKDRKTEKWENGKVKDFSIEDREEKEWKTDSFPLKETSLKSGYYWIGGAPGVSRDKLDGFYLAVVIDGRVVRDYAMPSGFLEDAREYAQENKRSTGE